MKVLLTSDWHLDWVTAGAARLTELERYIDVVEEVVVREAVDFVFFLGDGCDPGGMLASLYAATMIDAARRFHRAARRGSVWIAGNHDVIESSRGTTTLSPVRVAMEGNEDVFAVFERPGFIELPGLGVLALPYVARDVETTAYGADLTDALRAASATSSPVCVLGHLAVPGARMSSESHELARGRDVEIPIGDVMAILEPVFVANGHYHDAQIVKYGGAEIIIPGSPVRLTFGERNDDLKGFTILEVA